MKKLVFFAILGTGVMFGQNKKKVQDAKINWWGYKVAKTEASSHTGDIKLKSGDLVVKKNKVVGGNFILDMNTINATDLTIETGKTKLEGHLKNGDFFEVEKFPTASFVIKSVKANKSTTANAIVTGDLTIKGVKKSISFPANVMLKDGVASLTTEKFSVNRQDFGVAYKSSMKDVFIKDDMEFSVDLSAK